jgi:biotin carboxyl carrier protein
MKLELKIKDRIAIVEMIKRDGNNLTVSIDGKKYELDLQRLGKGLYSVLYGGKSYNIEMVQGNSNKQYLVNTFYRSYQIDIIDAESKYLQNRSKGDSLVGENSISTPMPGKVVKILVKKGESVEAGQTVIIVSAMKMESEFKVRKTGIIKAIHVNEGDLVEGNKVMIELE